MRRCHSKNRGNRLQAHRAATTRQGSPPDVRHSGVEHAPLRVKGQPLPPSQTDWSGTQQARLGTSVSFCVAIWAKTRPKQGRQHSVASPLLPLKPDSTWPCPLRQRLPTHQRASHAGCFKLGRLPQTWLAGCPARHSLGPLDSGAQHGCIATGLQESSGCGHAGLYCKRRRKEKPLTTDAKGLEVGSGRRGLG
jgi:hypothetical protein